MPVKKYMRRGTSKFYFVPTIAATVRSVMPTVAAMSRSRAAGLLAMHSSTWAWFVTNRQAWSESAEPRFMNAVTVVLSPVFDHLFERTAIANGPDTDLAQPRRALP